MALRLHFHRPMSASRSGSRPASRLALLVASCLISLGVIGLGSTSPAAQDQCVVVDDFSKSKVGEFPVGWKARKDEAKDVYKVAGEKGKHFLRADAKDVGIQIGKQFEWDLKEYPVLAWAWRPISATNTTGNSKPFA